VEGMASKFKNGKFIDNADDYKNFDEAFPNEDLNKLRNESQYKELVDELPVVDNINWTNVNITAQSEGNTYKVVFDRKNPYIAADASFEIIEIIPKGNGRFSGRIRNRETFEIHDAEFFLVTQTGNFVTELTQTIKNHLKYGEIKITLKNSSTGDIISTSVRKPIDPPISVPSSGVNVSVDVSGIHFENALQTGLIEEVINTRALVKTLPSGEQVFKSRIKVFVQEMNNGQGGWKTVTNEKTWWPSSWSEQKVWEKISEAFNNKVNVQGAKWHGTTADGVKIEMYLDSNNNISTAYIIP
jgi:hypothetical protein